MKCNKTALLIFLIAAILIGALQAHAYTGSRFGPWLYFAPYYFPVSGCCKGFCFSPGDFRPTYESPNPLPPGVPVVPSGPPPPITKCKTGACLPGPAGMAR
jgi:hypothetical protein